MARPLLLFAPGAGAPSTHPWMEQWAERLAHLGEVQRFDYDYMRSGRRQPDRLPQLLAAHRAALQAALAARSGPLVLIGKSMGGRVGCHLSLEEKVGALVCLGYPLAGGGDVSKLRDQVLRELRTPVLFVQGTRDSLCPLRLLEQVRAQMSAPNELFVVPEGDHSLQVTKRALRAQNETQAEVDARILQAIATFLARHLPNES